MSGEFPLVKASHLIILPGVATTLQSIIHEYECLRTGPKDVADWSLRPQGRLERLAGLGHKEMATTGGQICGFYFSCLQVSLSESQGPRADAPQI